MSTPVSPPMGAVGPYDLLRKLGEGGMGQVFLARHRVLGREAVIKRLHAALTENPEIVRRFVVEAQAAAKLSHRNVVEIKDVAQTPDGNWYLVLEYLKGKSLSDWMTAWSQHTGQPVGPWYACIVLAQIGNALQTAHDASIVHRDVKPENIFLTAAPPDIAKRLQEAGLPSDLHAKLLDFGIAKLLDGQGGAGTQTGIGIGTLSYMAPEQLVNAKDVDARADVYALGVVAFQLLTGGHLPWGEDTPAVILYKRQTSEPPPDARALVPALSVELAAVVQKAMACAPNDRWRSVQDFVVAFAQAVHADGGFPSGLSLVGAYAGELLKLAPEERTVGRVQVSPQLGQLTAPLPGAARPPVPVMPSATPWMTPSVEAPPPSKVTTHSSAVQVRASDAASPTSSRKGLLVALGAAGVLGGALTVGLVVGGGSSGSTTKQPAAAAANDAAPAMTLDAPEPATVGAAAVDAATPVDAGVPVDAPIDAGHRHRPRPSGPDAGSGADRGFRDLTK